MKKIRVLKPFRYVEKRPGHYRAITLYYSTHPVCDAHAAYGIAMGTAVEVAASAHPLPEAERQAAHAHWREQTRLPGGRAALETTK